MSLDKRIFKGSWRLPSAPNEKLNGELIVEPNGKIQLELYSTFDNDGKVKGLLDIQKVGEKISESLNDRMDPLPDIEMIPCRVDGMDVLQLKVYAGNYSPYYYVGDGQRVAFVRKGNQSVPATAEEMVRNLCLSLRRVSL